MKCVFCGNELKTGNGILSIKNDGTLNYFCAAKCQRNMAIRKASDVKWTGEYRKRKAAKVAPKK